MGWSEALDAVALVEQGKVSGAGEDSFCAMAAGAGALAAVFDGSGGAGAVSYPRYQGHTGAYIAARLASGAVHDWFCSLAPEDGPAELERRLTGMLTDALALGRRYTGGGPTLRGSLMATLPTTAAIAAARWEGGRVTLDLFWAGDSRLYLLDWQGLAQLSRDDCAEPDPFRNLSVSAPITNLLCADEPVRLHHARLALGGAAVVFAATDGCFDALDSPMAFEDLLLEVYAAAQTPAQGRARLRQTLSGLAQDDFALAALVFGFGDFPALRRTLAARRRALHEAMPFPLPRGEALERLWQDYRRGYERYLGRQEHGIHQWL